MKDAANIIIRVFKSFIILKKRQDWRYNNGKAGSENGTYKSIYGKCLYILAILLYLYR